MDLNIAFLDKNNFVINCQNISEEYFNMEYFENSEEYKKPDCIIQYDSPDTICKNTAAIGYILDEILCAFIPPCPDPTYQLDQKTFEWKPNPNIPYDLHNDGKLCMYNPDTNDWTPI
jgi:hypothetical protein